MPVYCTVPTAVTLGPDGAYYIGELKGVPFPKGAANVYRVDPATYETSIVHSGFTNIVDLTFDSNGNVFVLQISANGLASPTGPVPGALVKVDAENSKRTTIASQGLVFPGKVVAAPDGTLYVSNITSASAGGHVLSFKRVPWPADVNDDDVLDGDDVNALASAVATGSTESLFDLSGDGQDSLADLDAWLATKGTLNGDANLDGSVQFADFLVLANSYGQPGTWTSGDFDANGQVQFPDYTILTGQRRIRRSFNLRRWHHITPIHKVQFDDRKSRFLAAQATPLTFPRATGLARHSASLRPHPASMAGNCIGRMDRVKGRRKWFQKVHGEV